MKHARAFGVVGSIALVVGSLWSYHHLDLREPMRTRDLLARFERGDISAWDEYKMDPPRSSRAMPALIEGFRSASEVVRERAIVGACGLPRNEVVAESLRRLVQDQAISVRKAAEHCLAYDYRGYP